ncbi:MAG: hypothetical protein WDZ59_06590 [Pirellulales bacterium]
MKANLLIKQKKLLRAWPIGLLIFALSLGWPSFGQETMPTDTVPDTLHQRIHNLFEDLALGRAESAFDTLLRGSPLEDRSNDVQRLAERAQQLKDTYGAYQSHERITSKKVGSDVAVVKYLYKCADSPVVWYFTFYRPSTSEAWNVISVRFDTDLELLAL